MIASMTGFARRELTGAFGTLACELRSVNHRYLEPGFRLPEELRPLESELRQLLAKQPQARQGRLHDPSASAPRPASASCASMPPRSARVAARGDRRC